MPILECCDRAFHMECVTPHLQEVPESRWYCGTCVDCDTCKSKQAANIGVGAEENKGIKMLYNDCVNVDQSTTVLTSWGPSLHQCYACALVQLATAQVESRRLMYDNHATYPMP